MLLSQSGTILLSLSSSLEALPFSLLNSWRKVKMKVLLEILAQISSHVTRVQKADTDEGDSLEKGSCLGLSRPH